MKNICNFICDIFVTITDSIKNDSLLDMLMMWSVLMSVFVLIPVFVVILSYAVICALPYICLSIIICVITFIIPLSLRIVFKALNKVKNEKIN